LIEEVRMFAAMARNAVVPAWLAIDGCRSGAGWRGSAWRCPDTKP
jgi:hypothetical protein